MDENCLIETAAYDKVQTLFAFALAVEDCIFAWILHVATFIEINQQSILSSLRIFTFFDTHDYGNMCCGVFKRGVQN